MAGFARSVPLAGLLLAAGIALGGHRGLTVAAFATGLLAAAVGGGTPAADRVDAGRPVTVVGRLAEHPRRDDDGGWVARLAVERIVQPVPAGSGGPPGDLVVGGGVIWLALPDSEAPPGLGSHLRLRGHLSRSSGYRNAVVVPPGPWRLRLKSRRLLRVESPPGRPAAWATALRRRVEEALDSVLRRAALRHLGDRTGIPRRGRGGGAALVRALVLGDATDVPERWRRGLRRAGLSHLLAVSGLHVALVAGLVLCLAWPLPPAWRALAVLPAVLVYLLLAGPRPALLRAGAMGLLAASALLAGRPVVGGNALAVVAAALALHRPRLVLDLGFQLTVAATAGLLFLGPPLATAAAAAMDRLRESLDGEPARRDHALPTLRRGAALALRLPRVLAWPLSASLGAQVGSAAFALPAFHLLSWTAPLSNLVAVPWTALFLGLGLVWSALALLAPSLAAAALPWLDRAAAPFGWPALGPPARWGTLTLAAPAAAVVPAVVATALWMRRPRSWSWLLVPLVLTPWMRDGLPRRDAARNSARSGVAVTALDVGQGDALLLRDGGAAVLVDGGGWRRGDFAGRVLVPALAGEGVHRLRVAVVTHPDADHCRGLAQLASYLPIGEVWTAAGWETDPCVGELVAAAVPGRPSRWRRLVAGDLPRTGRWRFAVLHPPAVAGGPGRRLRAARRGRSNDRSLVLSAAALGRAVLLTGDVEAAAERALLRRAREAARDVPGFAPSPLHAELLKVAHHGSRTSTTEGFLRAVAPRLALISAGRRNPYGHPAPQVVERLRRAGVVVLRTDRRGAVRVSWRRGGALRLGFAGD